MKNNFPRLANNPTSNETGAAPLSLERRLQANIVARKQRGFTLVELIVVLAVIVVLATFMASKFSGDSSKAVKLFSDMKTLSDSAQRAVVDWAAFRTVSLCCGTVRMRPLEICSTVSPRRTTGAGRISTVNQLMQTTRLQSPASATQQRSRLLAKQQTQQPTVATTHGSTTCVPPTCQTL